MVEVAPTQHERGAYNAALECLRLYFNGEQGGVAAVPDADDDEPPAAGQGAKLGGQPPTVPTPNRRPVPSGR